METWHDISVVFPEVNGVDPEDRSKVIVVASLDAAPTLAWEDAFCSLVPPTLTTNTAGYHIRGDAVLGSVGETDAATWIAELMHVVSLANAYYRESVLPLIDQPPLSSKDRRMREEAVRQRLEAGFKGTNGK